MAVQNSEEKQEQGVKGTQTLMRALDIMDEVIDGPIRAADLARKLRRYINAYSKHAKPFRWKYSQPSRRIRHGKTISATVH